MVASLSLTHTLSLLRMNTHSGIRVARPWIKLRIAKSPSSGLHSKPPKSEPAPVQHEADEDSTKPAGTRLRKVSPEYRALQSEITKRRWAQPGYREKFAEYWSNPENKALRSERSKDMWAQPGFKEKHSATLREVWSNLSPEDREKRSAIAREWWSPEEREKASIRIKRDWSNVPERRERKSALMLALSKIPEQRDLLMRNNIFKRDDNNPTMKMRWEKMKEEARTFADSLNADRLRVEYQNAFIILHLDASQYDSKLCQTATLQKFHRGGKKLTLTDAQIAKLKEKFLENVLSTGLPQMSSRVFDELVKEMQCETRTKYLTERVNKERQNWLRAAAVLRRKGVDVDYANIPHLAWLEEVGRL